MINNSLPKNITQSFIEASVGKLECLIVKPTNTPLGIAIIFHPDPKAGGTNTNKVVQTIAKNLSKRGYIAYCPNLRGVGMSDGIHDNGVAEIDDAIDIYNHAISIHPGLPIVLSGFSFGSSVASKLALQKNYDKLILVGVAVTRYEVIVENTDKTIVIHGELDEIIPLSDVLVWAQKNMQPIICYPNTGHFFHGQLSGLQTILNNIELPKRQVN